MKYALPTPQSMFQQAVNAFQAGKIPEAEMLCQRCQQQFPTFAEAFHMHGVICGQSNRIEQGIALMIKANALDPRNAAILANLGELFRRVRRYQDAITAFEGAIRLQPNLITAWLNLGIAQTNAARHADALKTFRHAVKLDPINPQVRFNLGNSLFEYGYVDDAVKELEAATKLKPDFADAWINLANGYQSMERLPDALVAFETAQKLKPEEHTLAESIGIIHMNMGSAPQAREIFAKSKEHRKSQWLWELRCAEVFEPVAYDQPTIDAYQENLLSTIEKLAREGVQVHHDELIVSGVCPPMLLTYQQGREKQIREAYVKLFTPLFEPINAKPAIKPDAIPEVGLVVTHGHEGVFLKCFLGVLNNFKAQKVKLTVVTSSVAGSNIVRTALKNQKVSGITVVARDIRDYAKRIAERNFSVLHYFEVGSDSTNYCLPFFNAAPAQVASWGWPSSTRIPGIGYYQSSGLMESPESIADYSEKVFTPNCLPVCYGMPPEPGDMTRLELGLPEGRIYFSGQNLRKYQPRYDQALKQILDQDREGRLVILADAQPSITNLLLARFARAGLPMDRITVAPRAEYKPFIGRLKSANVVLDTFGYGGGANTVLDTLFSTTPQVTFPEVHHKTRWATAVLNHAGITHGIAQSPEDYAAQAVKIATDSDLNSHLRAQALAARDKCFDQTAVVDALEDWWLQLSNQP
jgi:protein O-GlcNAc transferase